MSANIRYYYGKIYQTTDNNTHLLLMEGARTEVDGVHTHLFVWNDPLSCTFYVRLWPCESLASTHSLWRPHTSWFRTTPLLIASCIYMCVRTMYVCIDGRSDLRAMDGSIGGSRHLHSVFEEPLYKYCKWLTATLMDSLQVSLNCYVSLLP